MDKAQVGLVTYKREGNIGFITLNRPEKRNAMNLALWKALDKAVDEAKEDQKARVIILQGNGKSFCAGLDLGPDNEIITMLARSPSAAQKQDVFEIIQQVQAIHTRLEQLPQPTIAIIHGHCLGAGLELVVCCDIRLAMVHTQFGLPEARLAIITDVGGLQRLARIVGRGNAREIAFRAHRFDAEWAFRINLINHLYPDKKTLEQEARKMAEEIAANPPLAVQGAKDVLLYDEQVSLDESLKYNAARSAMILPSEDMMEAMAAYLEKRPGKFKGA